MSGFMSKPKEPKVIQETTTPEVVDTSDKVKQEEQSRKKRHGVASQIFAGTDLTGIQTNKRTLGA